MAKAGRGPFIEWNRGARRVEGQRLETVIAAAGPGSAPGV
jgi:hypothetical protein